jgi:flagellar hook-associated protein 2
MPIRITGLNSGLDTEALVSELVSAYRKKTEKYTKARTKLSWKQDKWKDLNTKIKSFYNSISSLRFSTAYNLKSATVSNSTKATVKATSSAINGMYTLQIKQTAKSGYLTGGRLKSDTTSSSKLSDLGYTGGNGTISVNVNGKTSDIAVSGSTTISEFVDSLNKAGLKANYDSANQRIFVASSETGSKADFSLTGTDADGSSALAKLGLSVKSAADTANQKQWAEYALNTSGQKYITGYDSDGNAITNGTYDAAATQSNIQSLLQQMQTSSATVTNDSAQIAYAKAYKAVNDVDKQLNAAEQQEFKALLYEKDLSKIKVDSSGVLYEEQADGSYINKSDNSSVPASSLTGAKSGEDRLKELQQKAGFMKSETQNGTTVQVVDSDKVNAYKENMNTIASYEGDGTGANAPAVAAVQAAYNAGTIDNHISGLQTNVDNAQKFLNDNKLLDNASFTDANVTAKITNAAGILDGSITPEYSEGATRVNGQDAIIYVNDAEYVSTTNDVTVNGMTISALDATGDEKISVTVSNNVDGLYDKIKGVLKEYNELINEMTKLYNADTAKGYEPLTSEERDALSDSEIEDWEKKIKDSLLRRDDTLNSLINSMTSSMLQTYQSGDQKYSFSSFGIHTLGVLYSDDNEQNALHIDGDKDNALVSGNADKLMKALMDDPDGVVGFMQGWADSLYTTINKKMQSSSMSSFNVVYNDKEMAREYSDYTTTINKWEQKLQDIEDSYYKKFAAMESALAQLQAQQSNLASMLGM